jgi:hypothetical protein
MNLQTIAQSLEIGTPIAAGNLTMFPLLTSDETPAAYATLDEAPAAGFVKITEVSESGSVPELTIVNDGQTPVLVLDGEELIGAKQNRIVNLTILVPPRTRLALPVSCVEAARWAHRSRSFAAAGRTHYAAGRARKVAQVSYCMSVSGERRADQGAIWDDIDEKAARMAAQSETRAAAAMYEKSRVQLDEYLNGYDLRGEPVPDRRRLSEQVRTLVRDLGKAKLGHEDLHLGNFLLHDGKVYLLDGYAVRPGGPGTPRDEEHGQHGPRAQRCARRGKRGIRTIGSGSHRVSFRSGAGARFRMLRVVSSRRRQANDNPRPGTEQKGQACPETPQRRGNPSMRACGAPASGSGTRSSRSSRRSRSTT